MNMEHWNNTGRRKPGYSEKNLCRLYVIHHKYRTDWPKI